MPQMINLQQMSPFTRQLFDYERDFIKQSSEDPTVTGTIKANLVGRVLTLGVSLVLHAEAVCRAVYICFLTIKDSFSRSDEELLKKQREECSMAYDISLKSFFAIFYQKLLPEKPPTAFVPYPEGPRPMVHRIDMPASVLQEHFQPSPESDDDGVPVSPPAAGHLSDDDGVPVSPPAAGHLSDDDVVRVSQPSIGHPSSGISIYISPPAQAVAAEPKTVPPLQLSAPDSHSEHFSDGILVGVSSPSTSPTSDLVHLSPRTQPVAKAVNVIPHPLQRTLARDSDDESVILTPQEEMRIKQAVALFQKRENAMKEEARSRTEQEVRTILNRELADAQRLINTPNRDFVYCQGPEEHYNNDKSPFQFSQGHLGDMEVGICHFSNDPFKMKAEHLATSFSVTIGQTAYPVRLFGIFDPQIGSRAAAYLIKELPKVLANQLKQQNQEALSQKGIWNAISQTFLQLNQRFLQKKDKLHPLFDDVIADQGSSATVVFAIDSQLWTAHVGNSRVALDNGGTAILLSEYPDPLDPKYRVRVQQLGGTISDNGLVNGKLDMATGFGHNYLNGAISCLPFISRHLIKDIPSDSHVFIGTHGIFRMTSARKIVSQLHDKRDLDARELAHDCVYSIYKENQRSTEKAVKERSLSCLVIKVNADKEWEM